ncbi:hypothetical protein AB0C42_24105 [Micromonospora taraxaci]|uniref:hypothetical protein n=1 Tax=Micromonospora taraxaci TaxID=1316803 RepID=UPI0033CD7D4C
MWDPAGDDRWALPDDVRHLLLRVDDVLAELHDRTVHRYRASGPVVDENWPLTDAGYIDSEELAEVVESDEQGWAVLADRVGRST